MVQGCKPDLTDTEIGMSVFGGSLFVLAVVDMENCDLILAEGFVKLIQDEIRICCEIISCVVDVAGVEADAQPVRKTDTVIDCSQFFKAFTISEPLPAIVSSAMRTGEGWESTSFKPSMI